MNTLFLQFFSFTNIQLTDCVNSRCIDSCTKKSFVAYLLWRRVGGRTSKEWGDEGEQKRGKMSNSIRKQ